MAKHMQGIMTAMLVFGVIMLCTTVSVPGAWAKNSSEFLYIDCGATDSYIDPVTKIKWVPDTDYVNVGTNYVDVPNAVTRYSNFSELKTLRYFNNSYPKNCYSLPVKQNASYLLRASFYYGSYDQAATPPSFQMSIDATVVANITTDATTMLYEEFTLKTQNEVTFLCLSPDLSRSVPFISAISLRPGDGVLYNDFDSVLNSSYIRLRKRLNFGGSNLIRYPDDIYDRFWEPQGVNSIYLQKNTTTPLHVLTTTRPISMLFLNSWNDSLVVPELVYQTAITSTDNLTLSSLNNESDIQMAYLNLYFAELDSTANTTNREFWIQLPPGYVFDSLELINVFNDSGNSFPPIGAYSADVWSFYYISPMLSTSQISLYPASHATLGPILNGLELFEIMTQPALLKTIDRDAFAIDAIKIDMGLIEWTGDPCLPYPHSRITCTLYDVQPQILHVNLAAYNLRGNISSSFQKLLNVTQLLFDNNTLTGSLSNLSTLTHLEILGLSNNNFGGDFPHQLLVEAPKLKYAYFGYNQFSSLSLPNLSIYNFSLELLSFVDNLIRNVLYPDDGPLASANVIVLNWLFLGGNPMCKKIDTPLESSVCRYNPYSQPRPVDNKGNDLLKIVLSIISTIIFMVMVFLGMIIRKLYIRNLGFRLIEQELAKQEVKPKIYSYNELKAATNDFHLDNKVGEGGFGVVYKGVYSDNTCLAVKQLKKSKLILSDFLNEIVVISGVRHRNLVQLKGCCLGGDQRILVYEYAENKNLGEALWDCNGENNLQLDWPTRLNIILGIARGLTYLHEELQPPIIHRDIKPPNVLLDKNLNPKIADFGLALLFPDVDDGQTHITGDIMGTRGYLSPEYASFGHISTAIDVFSFGIVILEILSGRKTVDFAQKEEQHYLSQWAWSLYNKNQIWHLIDPKIVDGSIIEEVTQVIKVGLLCTQHNPTDRPKISDVVAVLSGNKQVENPCQASEYERVFFNSSFTSITTSSLPTYREEDEECSSLFNSHEPSIRVKAR